MDWKAKVGLGLSVACLLTILTGCSSLASRPVQSTPEVAEQIPAPPVPEPTPEPTTEAVRPGISEFDLFLMDAEPPEPERDPAEELLPGEIVSEAAHDELADVTPELSEEDLARERELVANTPSPTFDIPMVSNDQVLFWLDHYSNRQKSRFEPGLVRSGRYLPMFRRIFAEQGLPQDLVYMAHVESAYKTTAYSRARAAGIFQFISGTARRYGLKIDYWVDERRDPEKAAYAATAYLKKLYAEFGDWYLAMAAYNAGEGRIRSALRRSGAQDFWGIARTRYIRRETKNYVPAILAATMISKDPQKYGFSFDPDAPIAYDSIPVEGAVDLRVLAECAGSDLHTLKLLNPGLRRYQTPPHTTTDLRVPEGTGPTAIAALEAVPPEERVLFVRHMVRNGDTLYGLARAYGVTVGAIQQANKMGSRTMIRAGRVVLIPSSAAARSGRADPYEEVAAVTSGEALTYRVRRGDNLSRIARRHNSSAAAIAAASGISMHTLLQIGQSLTVVPGVRSAASAGEIVRGGGTTNVSTASAAVTHTVRRGDSLWRIASRYKTTVAQLCSMNKISGDAVLHPGTKLTVGYK